MHNIIYCTMYAYIHACYNNVHADESNGKTPTRATPIGPYKP